MAGVLVKKLHVCSQILAVLQRFLEKQQTIPATDVSLPVYLGFSH
jgi:hypothetical protein